MTKGRAKGREKLKAKERTAGEMITDLETGKEDERDGEIGGVREKRADSEEVRTRKNPGQRVKSKNRMMKEPEAGPTRQVTVREGQKRERHGNECDSRR